MNPSRPRTCRAARSRHRPAAGGGPWVALLVQRYLSNTASCILCAAYGVNDHRDSLHDSQLLKQVCVRQIALDK